MSEILFGTIESSNIASQNWGHWLTYALVIAFLAANVATEYWKQKALANFGALYVVPIFQVVVIVGGITFGVIYFEELETMETANIIFFIIAILITLTGVGKKYICLTCIFFKF